MRAVRPHVLGALLLAGAPRLANAVAPDEEGQADGAEPYDESELADLETEHREVDEAPFIDPRRRPPPRRHRFRLGLQVDYMRLTAAIDPSTGQTQRFHWIPVQFDFAYQLQFLKYLMLRPSLAVGINVANTLEAMPLVIHPQIFAGYQGSLLGLAVGYGYFQPPIRNKDSASKVRGGQGRPVISNNHQLVGEVSLTTRLHRRKSAAPGAGELSFAVRVGGVKSTLDHYTLHMRTWRFFISFNIGWYFGDGRRSRRAAAPMAPADWEE